MPSTFRTDAGALGAALLLHGLAAGVLLLGLQSHQAHGLPPLPEVDVQLETPPAKVTPPRVEPPRPQPPRPTPPPVRRPQARPPSPRPSPPPAAVAPAPPALPADAAAAKAPPAAQPDATPPLQPAPAPVVAPRFDAAYLNNPPPAYPAAAKRDGEEGRVLLRVHVTPDGKADDVQLQTGSGSPRLDEAARSAVRRWRFVPARQGTRAVAAWVLVPIAFKLED